jgi:hypothetical protein
MNHAIVELPLVLLPVGESEDSFSLHLSMLELTYDVRI